jgi:hypothetical protein
MATPVILLGRSGELNVLVRFAAAISCDRIRSHARKVRSRIKHSKLQIILKVNPNRAITAGNNDAVGITSLRKWTSCSSYFFSA